MRSQSTKWCLQRILSGYSNLIEQFFQLCFGLANTCCWTWLCLLNILISCNISYNPLTTLVMCRTCMYVKYLKREMWKRKRNHYCYKWQIWKPKRFTCFRLNRGLWHSFEVEIRWKIRAQKVLHKEPFSFKSPRWCSNWDRNRRAADQYSWDSETAKPEMWFQVQKDLQENTEDKRKTKSKTNYGIKCWQKSFFLLCYNPFT